MKIVLPFLMLAFFLAIIAFGCLFLSKKLSLIFPLLPPAYWKWLVFGVTFSAFIFMMSFMTTDNLIGISLFRFSATYVGFWMYVLLSMLLFSLVFSFTDVPVKTYGSIALGVGIAISLYGVWNSFSPVVKEVEIKVKGLQKEVRAVHLTDIHLGNFRGKRFLEKVVKRVNKLSPDVIFHTGDLFDAKGPLKAKSLEPFKKITAPHFFVEGNHDVSVGVKRVNELVRSQGLILLENEIQEFNGIQVIGLKHMLADAETFDMHAPAEGMTIKDVLSRLPIDDSKPAVMLHHSPNGEKYASKMGIDLILAGHTHGGQMFPLTYLSKLIFGYNSGLYKYENLFIYVSEGVGTMFSPMRIGTRSEITLIHLIPG